MPTHVATRSEMEAVLSQSVHSFARYDILYTSHSDNSLNLKLPEKKSAGHHLMMRPLVFGDLGRDSKVGDSANDWESAISEWRTCITTIKRFRGRYSCQAFHDEPPSVHRHYGAGSVPIALMKACPFAVDTFDLATASPPPSTAPTLWRAKR